MSKVKKNKKTTTIQFEESDVNIFCEACGEEYPSSMEDELDSFNYCPFCGRKIIRK